MSMFEFIRNTIGFYSLTAGVGLAVSLVLFVMLGKKKDISWKQSISEMLFVIAGLLIGAHLLFFLVGLPDWIKIYAGNIHSTADFLTAFANGASGLVFYGGLIGAYAGLLIFCKITRLLSYPEFNRTAVIIPLFHAFGRIGCTLTGCCYGIEYHGPLAITYDASFINPGISDDIADFSRFPVQPLESLIEFMLFALILIIYKKTGDKYSLTSIYLLIYSIARFSDEFLRGDGARKIWGPFSTSQWISLVIFVCVIVYLVCLQVRYPKKAFFSTKFFT